MSANYRNPNWLLSNELNQSINPSLSESRKSLYSMNFDGSGYINCGNSINVITSNYSISIWIKFTSTINLVVCEKGSNDELALQVGGTGNAGKISWFGGTDYWVKIDETINDGEWHHVACVADGSASYMYLDGALKTTGGSKIQASSNTSDFHIGGRGNSYSFVGSIDELAIWNKALSGTEVAALATASAPANLMALSVKPIAYWPLGEFAGNSGEKGGTPSGQTNSWKFPNQAIKDYVFKFNDYYANPAPHIGSTFPNSLNGSNKYTLSLWANFQNINSRNTLIASHTPPIDSASDDDNIQLSVSKNVLYAYAGGSYGARNVGGASRKPINNEWTNIIVVYDGDFDNADTATQNAGRLKIYINGDYEVFDQGFSAGDIPSSLISTSTDLTIGCRNPINSNATIRGPFLGEMSNVQLWNTNLSTSEIATIYNNGTPYIGTQPQSSNLKSWYKLNAATSSYNPATSTWTITDSAGSNNGTSTTLPSTSLIPSDLQFESPYSNFSLYFDGTNPMSFTPTIPLGVTSISFWMKSTDTSNGGITSGLGNLTFVGTSPLIRLAAQNYRYFPDQAANFDGNWHHWFVLIAGSNQSDINNAKMFVDGVELSAGTTVSSGAPTAWTSSQIGNSPYAGSKAFTIDEFAIWQSDQSSKVNQIYNNGRPGDLTSLSPVSWWRLGEDAYFVNNNITIPNQISGGPTGTGSGTQTAMLVADAPQSYGGGYGVGLQVTDKIGDAPESTANSISYNMIPDNRHAYTPGYAPAQVDNAFSMSFNGVDSFIDLNDSNIVNGLTSTSFSFWVNVTTPTAFAGILTSRNGNDYILIYLDNISGSDFKIRIQQRSVSGGGTYTVTTSATLTAGNWYNIVCTGTVGGKWDLYVNGDKTGQVQSSATITAITQSADFIAGDDPGAVSRHLNGKLDELSIFDYALTAKQIKEDIYNASTTGKTADLSNNSNLTAPVAWYRMGD